MSLMPGPSRRSLLTLAGVGAGAIVLSACGDGGGGGTGSGDALTVVTSNYPLSYVVDRVGGDRVEVTDLATPGADAHGLELSVKQVMAVQEAALVLQIPRYQAALDDAISSGPADNVLDVSSIIEMLPADGGDEHGHDEHAHASDGGDAEHADEEHSGHDHGPTDPHFWHDPLRLAEVADALAARLGEIDPEGAEAFTAAAAEVRSDLEALDAELDEQFDTVDGDRTFITSHAAYAYLAARYDLHQVGIAGVDPETEPSPRRLLELEQVIDEEGVTTIFFETTASPKVAQTLAENVGVDSAELDNLETRLDEDADYPAVMRNNCQKLLESWA
ncbi:metal ABC transporter substrate-binding protein [Brachybacterium fresconis]|uniref:Zinc transport system substrate-binding protein n=1 Tax=Brachybacterium fresconis TaxID=173363 RepID=A0ABS4YFN9_9MICO|nr:metal ABC transporter substrate-binding protein [Brachybacterium fresconis]MBP2407612.1 zinc transport system substrate-binding protein [Brachybacterium fresconis]